MTAPAIHFQGTHGPACGCRHPKSLTSNTREVTCNMCLRSPLCIERQTRPLTPATGATAPHRVGVPVGYSTRNFIKDRYDYDE